MKIIQLGMGGMAEAWIKAVLASPVVSYAAFVEINDDIAAAQRQKHKRIQKVPVFKTLPEALHAVQADGVVSVIPPQFRVETAQAAFGAGLPLLAEKPLASSMADAHKLLQLAQSSGLLYMVGQDYRYKRTFQTLKQVLDSGAIGRLDAIDIAHYKGLELTTFHSLMEYPLLHDMSIHYFDLLRFFLGSEPLTIYGRSWNPPWSGFKGKASAVAVFTFPQDITVTYHASWVSTGLNNTWDGDWRFEGEKGVIVMHKDRIRLQKKLGLVDRRYTFAPAQSVKLIEMPRTRQAYLIQEFYEAVTHGKPPATTIQDNIKSLQMVFDVIESSKSGRIIKK